jgi:hypothetical protein
MGEGSFGAFESVNPTFEEMYASQSSTPETRTARLEYDGKQYNIAIDIVSPLTKVGCDYVAQDFPRVSERQISEQYENAIVKAPRQRMRAGLFSYSEHGDTTNMRFVVSKSPDHELLYGRLIELGYSEEEVRRAGVTGLIIPVGEGLQTRVVIKSDVDFDPQYDKRYQDNWDIFYPMGVRDERVVMPLKEKTRKIVAVGHEILRPVARELVGNPRAGEHLSLEFSPVIR